MGDHTENSTNTSESGIKVYTPEHYRAERIVAGMSTDFGYMIRQMKNEWHTGEFVISLTLDTKVEIIRIIPQDTLVTMGVDTPELVDMLKDFFNRINMGETQTKRICLLYIDPFSMDVRIKMDNVHNGIATGEVHLEIDLEILCQHKYIYG